MRTTNAQNRGRGWRMVLIVVLRTQIPVQNSKQRWKLEDQWGMMEPLVTRWPCEGRRRFCSIVWKVGILMIGNCAVGCSWWYLCGQSVDISDARFLGCVEASPSAGPAHLIKFFSFIFHSSAASSSYSALAPLSGAWLTAPWEPKLWADCLAFWWTSPGHKQL